MNHVEGGYTKCWKEDPWAMGAHSIGTRNQMTSLLPHLMKLEGRIYFAGQHASAYHGWMQGAIESGNRAAKEINRIEKKAATSYLTEWRLMEKEILVEFGIA